jgi:hypothetical protein
LEVSLFDALFSLLEAEQDDLILKPGATTSGFIRPSTVGPELLKDKIGFASSF